MTETTILDDSAVNEIEDRANAATEGPWTWTYHPNTPDFPNDVIALASDRAEKDVLLCTGNDDGSWGEISEPDAALIAHAREDIPALCATVKHLRQENQRAETVFKFIVPNHPFASIEELAKPVLDKVDQLQSQLEQLRAENERLLRGDLTDEELQGFCHNLSERDRDAFFEGCTKYQERLFGTSAIAQLKENQ